VVAFKSIRDAALLSFRQIFDAEIFLAIVSGLHIFKIEFHLV
jgi:hypothetical protein